MLALAVILYPLLVAGVAALVRVAQPGWTTARVVLLTNLPAPLCLIAAAAVGVASIGPAAPDEVDAGGMAIAVYMIGGTMGVIAMLALGLPAAWGALRWMRHR